ncbi:hypothetical protein CR513_13635, partial [Mucuna pruriens]
MEPNGGHGMFSSLVGVENPHHLQHHPQMVPYGTHHDADPHPPHLPQPNKQGYPSFSSAKNKPQQSPLSDEDDDTSDPKRKVSPWQRMKWTDTMVRLLIMAVFYIGDEAGSEGTDKKKASTGLMQKKGKWKSVSRAMMEKGFYVSPQQCEDKFNDLNKRYKRVNDILGKGTACRVVENQNLLDTMDLSQKMKEEVKKLLNSKHLFFREMCAYHNSFGHGNNNNAPQQVESGGDVSQSQSQAQAQPHQQQQQQQCFHSSENMVRSLGGSEVEGLRMLKVGNGEEDDDDVDDDNDDDSEDDSDEDEDESGEGGSRVHVGHGHEDEDDGRSMRKRARKGVGGVSISPQLMQQLSAEVSGVFQDGSRSAWDKKQWMRSRIMQLEEQQLSYQSQAFELEKQRLKWARFSSKKEREMERAKLENERRRLESERMVLLIRQKELELISLHQQQQQQHSST